MFSRVLKQLVALVTIGLLMLVTVDDGRKIPGRKSVVDGSSSFTVCPTTRCLSMNLQSATQASRAVSTSTDVASPGLAVCRSRRPTMDLKTSTSEPSLTFSASASSSLTPTTTCSSTLKNMNTSSQVPTLFFFILVPKFHYSC